jgi:hypothetical protein
MGADAAKHRIFKVVSIKKNQYCYCPRHNDPRLYFPKREKCKREERNLEISRGVHG